MHKPRSRKNLNIAERILAIAIYDETGVYQRVASIFRCSWEQIKKIVLDQQSLLTYYVDSNTWLDGDNGITQTRKKINFLGVAMYEWIRRARYHKQAIIDEATVVNKALEFKGYLGINSFYPNRTWLKDFKSIYTIYFDNLTNLTYFREPEKSLNCADIIAYCRQDINQASAKLKQLQLKKASQPSSKSPPKEAAQQFSWSYVDEQDSEDESRIEYEAGEEMHFEDDNDDINENEEGPTIDFGNYEYYEQQQDSLTSKQISQSTEPNQKPKPALTVPNQANRLTVPLPKIIKLEPEVGDEQQNDTTASSANQLNNEAASSNCSSLVITNYSEALQHLQVLENFALEQQDFAAINLLSQLADVCERANKRCKRLK